VIEETELVRKEDIARWTRLFGPDEIYNFAAVSFIPDSWDDPYRAFQVNTLLVTAFLEVVKDHCPGARFYQASSSEIFGDPPVFPQNEGTPHNPVTPYGVSKLAAHQLVGLIGVATGFRGFRILYNHESPGARGISSPRRSPAAAEISWDVRRSFGGNIEAKRD
jgi:GDPmannose 4,6-dehydratase